MDGTKSARREVKMTWGAGCTSLAKVDAAGCKR